jgi:hypothetical protein
VAQDGTLLGEITPAHIMAKLVLKTPR